jgi:hypothetical protein
MKQPEGWSEPFLRGLWSPETLFGAPPFLLWITVPLFFMAVLMPSQNALWAMAGVQAAGFGLTQFEPEWAKIISDFLKTDGRIEP